MNTPATQTPIEGVLLPPVEGQTDLVQVRPDGIQTLFTQPGLVRAMVDIVGQAARRDYVVDLTTDKGRKAVASAAYRVAQTKTYLDGLGKDLVAELKALPRQIDANRQALRDNLDLLRDELRAPLTQWEKVREERKATLSRIQNLPAALFNSASVDIRQKMDELQALPVDADNWEEMAEEAASVQRLTLATLAEQFDKRVKWEADQLELERLRREKAEHDAEAERERLRKEGEERARKAQEQAAMAAPSVPAVAMMPPAMVPMLEQAMDAAGVPVVVDPEAPADTISFQQDGREVGSITNVGTAPSAALTTLVTDVEHRRTFNREALADMIDAMNATTPGTPVIPLQPEVREALATAVLRAIVQGKVRHIAITY